MAIVSYLRPIVTPFFVEKGFQKHQEVSFFFHLDKKKKTHPEGIKILVIIIISMILLMEGILHHLGCIKPRK